MSEQQKSDTIFGTAWPFAAPQMAHVFQTLAQELFDEAQKTIASRMNRLQKAMESSFRSFQALCSCKDSGAFASAYSEWLTQTMNFMVAEMNETRADALRWAEIGQKAIAAPFRSQGQEAGRGAASLAGAAKEPGQSKGSRTERAQDRSAAE